jgi:OOP family OmpA-OmpF porin
MKSVSTIAVLCVLMSCSHRPVKKDAPHLNPISLSPNANPLEELSMQQALMDKAHIDQVDVLAPIHFNEAKSYLKKADKQNSQGDASTDVLNTIGYSKAHLIKASQDASIAKVNMTEIISARNQAIEAGARKFSDKLTQVDSKLKEFTASSKEMNPEQKLNFKNDYLALELFVIKDSNLGKTKEILDQAKDKGAEKITPRAYQEALVKYNIAETLIETDRHNNVKISKAVAIANLSAERVMNLLLSEQSSRNQTPEQRAMALEARDLALQKADLVITQVDNQLAEQGEILAITNVENNILIKKDHDDQIVKDAAAQFNSNEAEVYLQEDSLVIRLKTMNFSSGRSDLPADSIAVLTKVKDVIKDIGPSSVMVQGHTDGVGSSKINQSLSENRAKSVKEFFSSDKLLSDNTLDFVGYGYTKPLASNKTKEGRAQNRRVDVIIKPNQSI